MFVELQPRQVGCAPCADRDDCQCDDRGACGLRSVRAEHDRSFRWRARRGGVRCCSTTRSTAARSTTAAPAAARRSPSRKTTSAGAKCTRQRQRMDPRAHGRQWRKRLSPFVLRVPRRSAPSFGVVRFTDECVCLVCCRCCGRPHRITGTTPPLGELGVAAEAYGVVELR